MFGELGCILLTTSNLETILWSCFVKFDISFQQMAKWVWTSKNPLTVQYLHLNTNLPKYNKWITSWQTYSDFVAWYCHYLKDIGMRGPCVHTIQQKATKISDYLSVQKPNTVKNRSCVMMLVWHHLYLHWIQIPCDAQVIDKASVFCQTSARMKIQTVVQPKSNFHSRNKSWDKNLNNIFVCDDASMVSSHDICSKEFKCISNDDKQFCERDIFGHKLTDVVKLEWMSASENMTKNLSIFSTKPILNTIKLLPHGLACSDRRVMCLYETHKDNETKIRELINCKEGYNLDSCEDYNCTGTYKCPGYYCIPWKYLCNGLWDCPAGYDEQDCLIIRRPGFFHCSDSAINILPNSVCDNIADCPYRDDEFNCELHSTLCPVPCHCYKFSIICTIPLGGQSQSMKTLPYKYCLVVRNVHWQRTVTFLSLIPHLQYLKLNSNQFPFLSFASSKAGLSELEVFVSSNNSISILQKGFLRVMTRLRHLNFSHNKIKEVQCNAFLNLSQLNTLLLTNNNLNNVRSCSFVSLPMLQFLDLSQNNILFVEKRTFSYMPQNDIHIKSDHEAFCCMKNKVNCYHEHPSCRELLASGAIRICAWVVALFILVANSPTVFESNPSPHRFMFHAGQMSHCLIGVVLVLLSAVDRFYGSDFVFVQFIWQKSMLCFSICFWFETHVILHNVSFLLITVSQYFVVHYPIESKFRQLSFVKHVSLVLFVVSLTLSLTMTSILFCFQGNLSNSLCLPASTFSEFSIFFTILLAGLSTTTSFVVPTIFVKIHSKLQMESQFSPQNQGIATKLKSFELKAFVRSTVCFLSFLPASTVFLVLPSLKQDYETVLMWTLTSLMALNALLDPFLSGQFSENRYFSARFWASKLCKCYTNA